MNEDKQTILRLFSAPDDYNDLIDYLDLATYWCEENDMPNTLARINHILDELQGPDEVDEQGAGS
jgi:hypothetical protein